MVVNLVDMYNTKYFYLPFGKDLTYLFTTCNTLRSTPNLEVHAGNEKIAKVFDCFRVGAEVKFDLAGGHYTSDITPILLTAQRDYGMLLIDSKERWREKILRENDRRFAEFKNGVQDTTQLPVLSQSEKAVDFIRSLSKDVVYEVPVSYPQEIWLHLITLISIFRPSVQLYLCNRESALLEHVARQLAPSDLDEFDEFYMITKQGIEVVNRSEEIYVQQLGYTDIDGAQSFASFVPTDFGKKQLKDHPAFRVIANASIHELNKYKNARKVTLDELF